jgi:hypothetical protein
VDPALEPVGGLADPVLNPLGGAVVAPSITPLVGAVEPPVGAVADTANPAAEPAAEAVPPVVVAAAVVEAAQPLLSPLARGLLLAQLLDPRFALDCHRALLGEYPTLGSAGAPGAPNGGGGIPWSGPVNAPAAAAATGGSSSRPGGDVDDWGMAVLALLALLALGGKPLMAAREVLGPASLPRLIPELPG